MDYNKICLNLDYQPPKSSHDKACLTLVWIQKVILKSKVYNVSYLIDLIKKQKINSISLDNWDDPICSNILNRIKKILREEALDKDDHDVDTLQGLLLNTLDIKNQINEIGDSYKEKVFEALNELQIELENSLENISMQALEHIHSDETIMTIGRSETVEAFLKQAGKTRKFHVIVAESAPSLSGHTLAKNLSSFTTTLIANSMTSQPASNALPNELPYSNSVVVGGIKVTLIPDSAIFAVMSRVNKVIIGAKLTLADGGIQAIAGARNIASAAKHYAVPVIICAGMYKLTPTYLTPCNIFASPATQSLVNYFDVCDDGLESPSDGGGNAKFVTSIFDQVPPELITFFISNSGSYSPSYVYQLMRELYSKEDFMEF